MTSSSRIRPMTRADADAVADLCRQLNYEVTAGEIAKRLAALTNRPDHAFLVAETADGRIAAFMHIHEKPMIEDEPHAQVQAICVDYRARGTGIGAALMAEAENWARDRGAPKLVVYSSNYRDDAHAFYKACGYEVSAELARFTKTLAG